MSLWNLLCGWYISYILLILLISSCSGYFNYSYSFIARSLVPFTSEYRIKLGQLQLHRRGPFELRTLRLVFRWDLFSDFQNLHKRTVYLGEEVRGCPHLFGGISLDIIQYVLMPYILKGRMCDIKYTI